MESGTAAKGRETARPALDENGKRTARRRPEPSGGLTSLSRFRLGKALGQGGEGTVYLAQDQVLDRPVAVKMMRAGSPAHEGWRERLLDEARNVGKLLHPNVVTLFDVGEHEGAPFLVFEYVQGETLSALLAREGRLPLGRALALLRQVLAGVAHAHAQGVAHLDLKPANVLVTGDDTPHIADFGTSRLLGAARPPGGVTMGTPRYLTPEHVTGGELGLPADVFALGLITFELLTGRQALRGADLKAIRSELLDGHLPLPSRIVPDLDPRLDAFVLRALERDPLARYPHAGAMGLALDELAPPAAAAVGGPPAGGERLAALDFLLLRMRHKGDFPALSRTLGELNRLTAEDTRASASQLANVILRDYALTERLLRLANSAFYGPLGRPVRNVSEAVTVLGFRQVRAAATSLIYGGQFGIGGSPEGRESIVSAFMSGLMTRHLARAAGCTQVEDAFLCGLFHNLGRSLTLYYFPEEYAEIRRRHHEHGLDWDAAARSVLDLSLHELGVAVARGWRFPEPLVQAIQAPPKGAVEPPGTDEDRLHRFAALANEVCDAVADATAAGPAGALAALAERYAAVLPDSAPGLPGLVGAAATKVGEFGPVIGFEPSACEVVRKALAAAGAQPTAAAPAAAQEDRPRQPGPVATRSPTRRAGWLRRLLSRLLGRP
jgi:HD-like signal output (HDOD) protein/tRNA A-37 threonylcarbamoyl transferase component Bud32